MAIVLLAWELGAGAGHCAELAPIAKGLIQNGHTVLVAARELVTARRVFGAAGVEYFQAPFLSVRPADTFFYYTFFYFFYPGPNNWNSLWRNFFEECERKRPPTKGQILNELDRIRGVHGLPAWPRAQ